MPAEVTIVTVAHDSMAVLPQMLASVPPGIPVVVVDNASQDGTALSNLCKERGAALLVNADNNGFGRACNQGAALSSAEFLLFLNPDARLADNTLVELVAAARRYPDVVAMNPRIINPNGSAYFKRRSSLLPRTDHMPRGWPETDREVTVLSGSALFVRRKDFQAVGGFDPAIFLYHEDDDLSVRLRRDRGRLMFVRAALVQHLGGKSSVRSTKGAAFKAWHMARSRVYAMRKHRRPLPFVIPLLSAFVGLLRPDLLVSARRRAKNWSFLKGVLSTLRDGGAMGER